MISTAYYPYPANNDKSSTGPTALQPHIYSPPESHSSPRSTMYPHLHPSGSPIPSYIYTDYENCYTKDSWVSAAPSWSTFYPPSPLSSSLPATVVNPKITILPPRPVIVSDVDTPSSISSHSILTPSSPFAQQDVDGVEFMDFDEFDFDDEDDFVDSDFADEMEGTDEADQGPSPLYSASPHANKSTSALDGALGDAPSSSYGTANLVGVLTPADRRLSASVPGYPSNLLHRSAAVSHQRWSEKAHSHALVPTSPAPQASYPSQHMYTQGNSSLTCLFAPTSSSLAGAFASPVSSPHVSRSTSNPLPILQPQPIRPIPPIPLADLTSSANQSGPLVSPVSQRSNQLQTLSPLPLLCQPVSDVVRYQLKEPPTSGALDDACYDVESASESMSEDLTVTSEEDRFAYQGLTFCPEQSELVSWRKGCILVDA